jgi:hypothetical protein
VPTPSGPVNRSATPAAASARRRRARLLRAARLLDARLHRAARLPDAPLCVDDVRPRLLLEGLKYTMCVMFEEHATCEARAREGVENAMPLQPDTTPWALPRPPGAQNELLQWPPKDKEHIGTHRDLVRWSEALSVRQQVAALREDMLARDAHECGPHLRAAAACGVTANRAATLF